VTSFHPDENRLVVAGGDIIHYDFLVVALGFQLRLVFSTPLSPHRKVACSSCLIRPFSHDLAAVILLQLRGGRTAESRLSGVNGDIKRNFLGIRRRLQKYL
jgi:hypothetical protein